MNGFDDNYYTIQKIIYVVLKFLIALSGKYFFKKIPKNFKIGQILDTKMVFFTDFTIFHNLWNCEGPWK